jgi:hypothetical protein
MNAHITESAWPVDAANGLPPRDPNDDDDEGSQPRRGQPRRRSNCATECVPLSCAGARRAPLDISRNALSNLRRRSRCQRNSETGQTRRQKRPSPSVPTARRQQCRGEGECRDVADVLLDRLLSGPGLSLHAHAEHHLGSDREQQ